jgi:hypothetical protein
VTLRIEMPTISFAADNGVGMTLNVASGARWDLFTLFGEDGGGKHGDAKDENGELHVDVGGCGLWIRR